METQVQGLVGILVVLLSLCIYKKSKSAKLNNILPGPMPLPLIGNALQIGFKPHLSLMKMADKYGPIFKVKFGNIDVVVINDHKLMKELFKENESAGRIADNLVSYAYSRGPYGLINSEGKIWEEQRRFTVRTLKNLGFAKTSMESMILTEVQSMLNWFDSKMAKPIDGCGIFHASVVNSLWRIISGERCTWEQGKPLVLKYTEDWCHAMARITTSGVCIVPVLRYIAPGYLGWTKYVQICGKLRKLFEKIIANHKKKFDANNLKNFIDYYFQQNKNAKDHESSFYGSVADKNLSVGLADLFIAGLETTSNTLSWALLYLSQCPEIQSKLHQEIDQVIGFQNVPCLANRAMMPYTEATIAEILRKSSTVSLGLPHRMLESKQFHGYNLPKGIAVFVNIYGIHHRKDIWGDPQNFRPERFLNEDGTQFVKNDALVPYAEGKRKCIGDTLAKDTLFLFITSIFQRFSVLLENIGDKPDFEARLGYVLEPKPFKVRMVPRIRK